MFVDLAEDLLQPLVVGGAVEPLAIKTDAEHALGLARLGLDGHALNLLLHIQREFLVVHLLCCFSALRVSEAQYFGIDFLDLEHSLKDDVKARHGYESTVRGVVLLEHVIHIHCVGGSQLDANFFYDLILELLCGLRRNLANVRTQLIKGNLGRIRGVHFTIE